jgi:hypothetical protein
VGEAVVWDFALRFVGWIRRDEMAVTSCWMGLCCLRLDVFLLHLAEDGSWLGK